MWDIFDRGNQLVGGIPETLSKLQDLQSLDLSRNKVRIFSIARKCTLFADQHWMFPIVFDHLFCHQWCFFYVDVQEG